MTVTVQLQGMRELEQALADLRQPTAKATGRRVLKEAGEPVARLARSLVRVDQGELRESVDVSPTLTRSQRAQHSKAGQVEMFIGPSGVVQGITEEFGTWFESGHPFLRPAWAAESMNTLDRIGAGLDIEIRKATRRAERQAARIAAGS